MKKMLLLVSMLALCDQVYADDWDDTVVAMENQLESEDVDAAFNSLVALYRLSITLSREEHLSRPMAYQTIDLSKKYAELLPNEFSKYPEVNNLEHLNEVVIPRFAFIISWVETLDKRKVRFFNTIYNKCVKESGSEETKSGLDKVLQELEEKISIYSNEDAGCLDNNGDDDNFDDGFEIILPGDINPAG